MRPFARSQSKVQTMIVAAKSLDPALRPHGRCLPSTERAEVWSLESEERLQVPRPDFACVGGGTNNRGQSQGSEAVEAVCCSTNSIILRLIYCNSNSIAWERA